MLIQEEINQENQKKVSSLNRLTFYLSFVFVVPFVLYVRRKKQITQMITKINQANDSINKKLSKRRELLLKLVDTTKQEVRWQRGILIQITKLRNINLNSLSMEAKIEFSRNLDQLAQSISNQIERKEDWKNHITNHRLPKEIEKIEAELLASKEKYNAHVVTYNQFIQDRPKNLIANKMGLGNKNLFETNFPNRAEEKFNIEVE